MYAQDAGARHERRERALGDVRIVDRGPVRAVRSSGVVIDVSRAAADALGFLEAGRTRVRLEVVRRPPDL